MSKTKSENESSRYHVPNLERALVMLEFLAKKPYGVSMTEIVDALGFPKNSVFRIATTLVNHGYLSRDNETKKFALTKKLLSIGETAVCEEHIIEASLDIMRRLRNELDETVLLGTLLESEGVVLEQAPGGHPFKFMVDLGTRFKIHCSAPGKAILAYLPEDECEAVLNKISFTRFNERTIVTKPALREELKTVRDKGYAPDFAEEFESVHCIGAPILDKQGYPVASIWITGPSTRIPEKRFDEIGGMVREYADFISERLGYGILSANPENEVVMK